MFFKHCKSGLRHARVLVFLLTSQSAKFLGHENFKCNSRLCYHVIILYICILLFMPEMMERPCQQMQKWQVNEWKLVAI
jgi:hypothetical protein